MQGIYLTVDLDCQSMPELQNQIQAKLFCFCKLIMGVFRQDSWYQPYRYHCSCYLSALSKLIVKVGINYMLANPSG
jgi:hypothetical protein